ncbi:MAG: DUF502 domain-containing protein [Candidatus Omnitrophota bacterium]
MGARLKRYFISGLIIFLPLALTVYFFVLMIQVADGLLGKFIEPYFAREFGFYFRGISIIVSAAIIFLIGFLATNFLGRRLYPVFENLLLRLPFFKQVYPAFKQMAIFLFSRERPAFKQVVLVEYPRKGIYSIGFLTNDTGGRLNQKLRHEHCNVFVPSSPGPLTGFVILVPKHELIYPDISIEDAIKLIVSGGVVNP